jgi:hypothetical protein
MSGAWYIFIKLNIYILIKMKIYGKGRMCKRRGVSHFLYCGGDNKDKKVPDRRRMAAAPYPAYNEHTL